MRISIRADSSTRIGAGHAMRCLTLANELVGRGCKLLFVSARMPDYLAERIENSGHELRLIEPSDRGADQAGWDLGIADPGEQCSDAAATRDALCDWQPDWLVVDYYRFDRDWEAEVRHAGLKLLVIDDLANRHHDCDILLDQTAGRTAEDYRALTPAGAELLIGGEYALLRPEFERARAAAAERRGRAGSVRRILISLGMTDLGGLTQLALEQTLAAVPDCSVDVVLGSAAPSLGRVRQLSEANGAVTLHVDSDAICDLMVEADLAVGAAGTTSWERCCLGLPTVTLALAPNQQTIAQKLAEAGAVQIANAEEDGIRRAVGMLASDEQLRLTMSRNALRICDGGGTRRLADRITAGKE